MISLVTSLGIVCILLYRSFNIGKLTVPLHRLLLDLSVADTLCSSFAQAWSNLPSPDSSDMIWNAHRSQNLCQPGWFLIFIGSIGASAPLYKFYRCACYLCKRKINTELIIRTRSCLRILFSHLNNLIACMFPLFVLLLCYTLSLS